MWFTLSMRPPLGNSLGAIDASLAPLKNVPKCSLALVIENASP